MYRTIIIATKAISIPDTIVAIIPIVLAWFCFPLLLFKAIRPSIRPTSGAKNAQIKLAIAISYLSPFEAS
jgi:hypothetical protein